MQISVKFLHFWYVIHEHSVILLYGKIRPVKNRLKYFPLRFHCERWLSQRSHFRNKARPFIGAGVQMLRLSGGRFPSSGCPLLLSWTSNDSMLNKWKCGTFWACIWCRAFGSLSPLDIPAKTPAFLDSRRQQHICIRGMSDERGPGYETC